VQVRKEDQGTRVWKIRIWRDKTRRCTTNTMDDSNLVVGMLRRLGIQGGSLVRVEGTCNLVPATCKTFLFCYHACNYTTTMAKKHMHAPTTPFRSTVVTRHRTIIRLLSMQLIPRSARKRIGSPQDLETPVCVLLGYGFLFSQTSIKPTCTYPVLMFHATQQHVIKLPWFLFEARERSSILRKQQARRGLEL